MQTSTQTCELNPVHLMTSHLCKPKPSEPFCCRHIKMHTPIRLTSDDAGIEKCHLIRVDDGTAAVEQPLPTFKYSVPHPLSLLTIVFFRRPIIDRLSYNPICVKSCNYNMDANNPNKDRRTTPEYAEYQRDNFWKSNDGEVPPFNTGK